MPESNDPHHRHHKGFFGRAFLLIAFLGAFIVWFNPLSFVSSSPQVNTASTLALAVPVIRPPTTISSPPGPHATVSEPTPTTPVNLPPASSDNGGGQTSTDGDQNAAGEDDKKGGDKSKSNCTPERDRQEAATCAALTKKSKGKPKYVLNKAVKSPTQCAYKCVPVEHNAICAEQEKTYFPAGDPNKPNLCSICGDDQSTIACTDQNGQAVAAKDSGGKAAYDKLTKLGALDDGQNTSTVGGGNILGTDAAFQDPPKLGSDGRSVEFSDGTQIPLEDLGLKEASNESTNGWITPDGKFIPQSELQKYLESDVIQTGGSTFNLPGGFDSDLVTSHGSLYGGAGNDTLLGGAGNDTNIGNTNPNGSITSSGSNTATPSSPSTVTPSSPGSGYQSSPSSSSNGASGTGSAPSSGYQSFTRPQSLANAQSPRFPQPNNVTGSGAFTPAQSPGFGQQQSFAQRFASAGTPQTLPVGNRGGFGNFVDNVRSFISGAPVTNYQTPQGQTGGSPRVVYVVPDNIQELLSGQPTQQFRTVQEIASDVAAQTEGNNLPRVDHFAQTLQSVGGPSTTADTENKSFGRIQDLIVEDEAIRALRKAEEAGKQAKNTVFCRPNEDSDVCQTRRDQKQKDIERTTFVQELHERVLPDSAIQHFLAVYDGWVRPSPAPSTRATSTLALLEQNDVEPLATYEQETGGTNFVLWAIEGFTSTAKRIADTVTGALGSFFGGGEEDTATSTPAVETNEETSVSETPAPLSDEPTIDSLLDEFPDPSPSDLSDFELPTEVEPIESLDSLFDSNSETDSTEPGILSDPGPTGQPGGSAPTGPTGAPGVPSL